MRCSLTMASLEASRWVLVPCGLVLSLLLPACSDSPSPAATGPDPVLTSLSISGSTSFSGPGQASQLSAVAAFSNSATQNVTATAVWQTSNAQVAVVSGDGLLTAQGAGSAEVTASYQGQVGRASVTVGAAPCSVALSASAVTFERNGGTRTLGVQASSSSCAWQAASNASWILVTGGGSGSGNGSVSYDVAPNSGATTREGVITVSGPALAGEQRLTVRQTTGAASCRYCPSPTSRSFSSAGGTSSVSIDPTDATTDWTAVTDQPSWLRITSGASGRGRGTVTYVVDRNGFGVARTGTISVGGLSGLFPRETHVVTQQP
jgi:hypothetical protein